MGLFTPAWLRFDAEKGCRAVSRITDQSKLAEIARRAPIGEVREAAIDRLTDDRALAALASEKGKGTEMNVYDRGRALMRIRDDELLADAILANAVSGKDAEAATAKLQSQQALYRVAAEQLNFRAFERITDAQQRLQLCLKNKHYSQFSKLESDPELWVELGMQGGFPVNKTVDYCRKLIDAGDLRGVDILVRFVQKSNHNHYLHEAVSLMRTLYRRARDGGDAELERRVLALPRGFYGPHTDNHYEDCGYGSHNDSPRAHFDVS